MGSGIGVYCEACGWERQFYSGCGFLSYRKEDCLESLRSGEFGELARRMSDELSSDEVELRSQRTTYRCGRCGELVPGRFITAHRIGTDEMPVVFIACEDTCPACGRPMTWVRGIPVEADVRKWINQTIKKGCPECGGNLGKSFINWD